MNLWHYPFWAKLACVTYGMFKPLLMHHLILDLVGINRAWLYKEPLVSVLQANAQLVQQGGCWTWNQKFMRGPGSILTVGNILLLDIVIFT